jgi:hypothetical protein
MMPESASATQKPKTIIEIRPFKGGWQCFEGPGGKILRKSLSGNDSRSFRGNRRECLPGRKRGAYP